MHRKEGGKGVGSSLVLAFLFATLALVLRAFAIATGRPRRPAVKGMTDAEWRRVKANAFREVRRRQKRNISGRPPRRQDG